MCRNTCHLKAHGCARVCVVTARPCMPTVVIRSATLCNTVQHTATHGYTLERDASASSQQGPVRMSRQTSLTLQHIAKHYNTLQHIATHCTTLQHTNTLQHTTKHCNTLQHTIQDCNTLQKTAAQHTTEQCIYDCTAFAKVVTHTATHCNTLQHAATRCNTLQHAATHCNSHAATHTLHIHTHTHTHTRLYLQCVRSQG